jgi:TP901 family phage tail tape measure protein
MADTIVFTIEVNDQGSDVLKEFENRLKDLEARAQDAQSRFGGFGDLINSVFSMMKDVAVKAAESVREFVSESVSRYMAYQDALVSVNKYMGLTGKALDQFSESFREMSIELGTIPEQLLNIANIGKHAGIATESLAKYTEIVAKFAGITGESTDAIAESLPRIIQAWENVYKTTSRLTLDKDLARVSSVVLKLGANFNATEGQIMRALTQLGPSAANFGLTMEQSAALATTAIELMGNRFSSGITTMSQLFSKSRTDSGKWAAALQIDAESLKSALIKNPVQGLQMIFEAYQKLVKQDKLAGTLIAPQALKELGLTGSRVMQVFEGLANKTGTFSNALKMANTESELFKKGQIGQTALVQQWAGATGRLSFAWTQFKLIVNDLYLLFGKDLVESFGKIMSLSINPLIQQFREWLKTSNFLKETWPAIIREFEKGIISIIGHVRNWVLALQENTGFWEGLKTVAVDTWNWIKTTAMEVWDWIRTNLTQENLTAAWVSMKSTVDVVIEALKTVAQIIVDITRGFEYIDQKVRGVSQSFQNFQQKLADMSPMKKVWEDLDKDTDVFTEKIISYHLPQIQAYFQQIGVSAEQVQQAFGKQNQAIKETTESGKALHQTMNQGTLPAMQTQTQNNTTAMQGLKTATDTVTSSASALDTQIIAAKASLSDVGNMLDAIMPGMGAMLKQAEATAKKATASKTPPPPVPASSPSGSETMEIGRARINGNYGSGIVKVSPGVYANIANNIYAATTEFSNLEKGIMKVDLAGKKLGETMYGRSVLPDIETWTKKDTTAQEGLRGSIERMNTGLGGVVKSLQTMDTASKTIERAKTSTDRLKTAFQQIDPVIRAVTKTATNPENFILFDAEGLVGAFAAQREIAGQAWQSEIAAWQTMTVQAQTEIQRITGGLTGGTGQAGGNGGLTTTGTTIPQPGGLMSGTPPELTNGGLGRSVLLPRAEEATRREEARPKERAPIIFEGPNIIDDRSMEQFTRKITETQDRMMGRRL